MSDQLPNEFTLSLNSELSILSPSMRGDQEERNYILANFKFGLKKPIYFDQDSAWEVGLKSVDCPLIPITSVKDGRLTLTYRLTNFPPSSIQLPFRPILTAGQLKKALSFSLLKSPIEKYVSFIVSKKVDNLDKIELTISKLEKGESLEIYFSPQLKALCGYTRNRLTFRNDTIEPKTFAAPRHVDPFNGSRYVFARMEGVKPKVSIELLTDSKNRFSERSSDNILDSFCLFDGQSSDNLRLSRVDYYRHAPQEISYKLLSKSSFHSLEIELLNEESTPIHFYGRDNFIQIVLSFRRVNTMFM